jgi:hypothetical protein
MARRARYRPLNVFLNARLLGKLRRETSGPWNFNMLLHARLGACPAGFALDAVAREPGGPVAGKFLETLGESAPAATERVLADLPKRFPKPICGSIANGFCASFSRDKLFSPERGVRQPEPPHPTSGTGVMMCWNARCGPIWCTGTLPA